jgi:hypothetical protein
MSLESNKKRSGFYRVQDAAGVIDYILKIFVALFLFALSALFYFIDQFDEDIQRTATGLFSAAMLLLALLFTFQFKANKGGYIIDVDADLFEFPGRKVMNDAAEFFSLSFWNQAIGVSRERIKLSEITRIEKVDEKIWDKKSGEYMTVCTLNITGEFGSIQTSFGSGGKRDQLYSLLATVLEMGEPVVIR